MVTPVARLSPLFMISPPGAIVPPLASYFVSRSGSTFRGPEYCTSTIFVWLSPLDLQSISSGTVDRLFESAAVSLNSLTSVPLPPTSERNACGVGRAGPAPVTLAVVTSTLRTVASPSVNTDPLTVTPFGAFEILTFETSSVFPPAVCPANATVADSVRSQTVPSLVSNSRFRSSAQCPVGTPRTSKVSSRVSPDSSMGTAS